MKRLVMMMAKDIKEEDEDPKKASNQEHQLNSKPSPESNFNMFIIPPPPQNQIIDTVGNKYFFVDTSGNPFSPVLQMPIPIGQIPIVQGTSAGVQFLVLNPNPNLADPSPISNSSAVKVEGKGPVIKPKGINAESVQLPIINSFDEVVYVNPKQYKRILIRRKHRCRLQEQGKIPFSGERQKYLHESRHLHAKNRCRESGGRFGGSPTQDSKG